MQIQNEKPKCLGYTCIIVIISCKLSVYVRLSDSEKI